MATKVRLATVSYMIGVQNRYSAFLDDDDGFICPVITKQPAKRPEQQQQQPKRKAQTSSGLSVSANNNKKNVKVDNQAAGADDAVQRLDSKRRVAKSNQLEVRSNQAHQEEKRPGPTDQRGRQSSEGDRQQRPQRRVLDLKHKSFDKRGSKQQQQQPQQPQHQQQQLQQPQQSQQPPESAEKAQVVSIPLRQSEARNRRLGFNNSNRADQNRTPLQGANETVRSSGRRERHSGVPAERGPKGRNDGASRVAQVSDERARLNLKSKPIPNISDKRDFPSLIS